ncbi:MAG: hypothetical protein AAF629_06775 [Chloroflexota bacterium]
MQQSLNLGPNDIVMERPFTHPSHTFSDMYVLRYIIDQLCLTVQQYSAPPTVIHQTEPDGRPLRLVILQPDFLNHLQDLAVVGFFGHKQAGVSFDRLDHMDEQLIDELPHHTGLLSYCTLRLHGDSSANLVLFAHSDAKATWGTSDIHSQAVHLAPYHYASVRIYNGQLSEGVHNSGTLRVTTARYFDYQSNPFWRATRQV